MADTTKTYENIFIKKNAAGDREHIKVPYAILADPPTIPDVSGFMPKSGGTFTGDVTFNKKINLGQGDANCLYLGSDGRLNGPENRTLFGLVSGSATFGHQAYSLRFRGSATRPQYTTDGSNYKDLALKSDIPDVSDKANLSGGNVFQGKQEFLEDFILTSDVNSINPHRVFSDSNDMLAYLQNPNNTYKYTSQTVSAFIANTDANNRTVIVDGRIDNKKNGTKYELTLPTKTGTLALTSDIPDISGKLDKTAYEVNKTINFGRDGALCVGKFMVYDTNVTCEITSTTSVTYSGKLVIATQNYVITEMTVYGDAANTVTPNIYIKPSSESDPYIEVYFKPASWSKNVIHIYGSAIAAEPTNVCTNVSAVPSTATLKPTNALNSKANLEGDNTFTGGQTITGANGGYSINASGYIKGSWLQATLPTNKGSDTGKVCVFDGAGWIYYRTPAEILSEAGGIIPFCMDDLSTGTFGSTAVFDSGLKALYFEDTSEPTCPFYGVLYAKSFSGYSILVPRSIYAKSSAVNNNVSFVQYIVNDTTITKNIYYIETTVSTGKTSYRTYTSSGTFYYKTLN